MRLTFLGHVGFSLDTRGGSLLCDPWFTPAYFGSWFPFPRNDRLEPAAFGSPDYLYISHLHRDHFDPRWLARHVDKGARVLLPEFGVPYLEEELRALGFRHFVPTRSGEPVDLDGLTVTIVAFTTPADGPLGDSLVVVDDGSARILNQNDARPGDPDGLRALGPFDAQIVQFSGAIWYPVAYDFPADLKTRLASEKRVNQMARARQYIEWVDAAHVIPCAGPPAFLDDDLVGLNDFDRDPANIFPDQTVFLELLRDAGIDRGELVVPGSVVDLDAGECKVTHPGTEVETTRPFTESARTSTNIAATGRRGSRTSGSRGRTAGAISSPSWRRGSNHCSRARRSRRPASQATWCSTSANRARTCASTSSSPKCGRGGAKRRSRTSTRPTSTAA